MSCRTSTALRTTTGLILEFFLRALLDRTARWSVLHLHRAQCRPQSLVGDDSGTLCALRSGIDSARSYCPVRFSHEAVNHVVRVEVKSGHRPVRSNAPPRGPCSRARNVELNDGAVLVAHKAVIHICTVNVPSRGRSIRIDIPKGGYLG